MKILTFIIFLFVSFAASAEEDIIHMVGGGKTTYEYLTQLKMQKTLISSAQEYEKYGRIARATHHDMAYPKDKEEYSTMNGFGILWVTSHSQIQKELPIKNLRLFVEGIGATVVDPIYTFPSKERHKLVSRVLGKYRYDSIYMIPFFKEMQGATLVADYAINRVDFVLGNIEKTYPSEMGKPIKLPKQVNYPDKKYFHAMLEREYPIAKALLESGR